MKHHAYDCKIKALPCGHDYRWVDVVLDFACAVRVSICLELPMSELVSEMHILGSSIFLGRRRRSILKLGILPELLPTGSRILFLDG